MGCEIIKGVFLTGAWNVLRPRVTLIHSCFLAIFFSNSSLSGISSANPKSAS